MLYINRTHLRLHFMQSPFNKIKVEFSHIYFKLKTNQNAWLYIRT